jgi:site-specific recombinase XerD
MAIFKRGRVYWYHFVFSGEHVQESTKQGSPRIARQMEAAHRTALAKGEVGLRDRKAIPAVSDAMRAFLEWSTNEHRSHPRTHRRYVTSSKALLARFRGVRLDQITAGDVERFKSERGAAISTKTARPLRPATVNRELACLKAMFNHAIKQGLLLANPVRGVKLLAEDNQQTRVLSFAEERIYLESASPRLREVAKMILNTGMRPEEVYRLERENVNLAIGFVKVPFGKTKAARRNVPLNRDARELLAERLDEAPTTRFLFPSERDTALPMANIDNTHKRTVRRTCLAWFRLYDLRHTFATRAAQSGMDLVTLASILGHARIQMVLRYAHPVDEHKAAAMQKMEGYVAGQRISQYEQIDRGSLQFPLQ